MHHSRRLITTLLTTALLLSSFVGASQPAITPEKVSAKVQEIMRAHVTHKTLTPELAQRVLVNYLEQLDPAKTYLVASDIDEWTDPADSMIQKLIANYEKSDYSLFHSIHDVMGSAIERRHHLEERIDLRVANGSLPTGIKPDEFKDLPWAEDESELFDRLLKIRTLQTEAAEKLEDEETKAISFQRIAKRRASYEDDFQQTNTVERERFILANVLKAMTASLDTHTAYFTPAEATQFMINVQQRLFGIGAQLRDDISGFTVVKVIEGGPAANGGELTAKDRIIAVDGEPVVGMDIIDAVELIRGEESTPVVLTVVREADLADGQKEEQKLDVTVIRGEVVLKESRLETSVEPFGDGVIAYLRLFSFYQDPEDSSSSDMAREIKTLKEQHNLKGIILDLRSNSGGMLSQAVAVSGLFMTKGVVCSIKDHSGRTQHLRDLDSKTVWDGPLVVAVNRASASAAEIVAQTMQDYGRALIVGDDHTFGKGTFQTFTLNSAKNGSVNPEGEYKVTRGRYYTVSGKSPQLVGVQSDIQVPGVFSAFDIGEQYAKYPLDNDTIKENFNDDLSDVPWSQRDKIRRLYKFDLQQRLTLYSAHIEQLKKNSDLRIANNKDYQAFLKDLENRDEDDDEPDEYGQVDLQLQETYNVMKDLIVLLG